MTFLLFIPYLKLLGIGLAAGTIGTVLGLGGAFTALAGASTHIAARTYLSDLRCVSALVIGVILGAQIGARFSQRVQGGWIIRGLALVIAIAGLRIVLLPK
jgi:hypothetical protein